MGMSDFYGGRGDDAKGITVIHRALDLGINFFDTSDMYGPFTNEKLVGKALADRRGQAVIATKFAIMRSEDGGFSGISGKPEYVKQACEASLKRLGVDTIDLYYQHRVDPQTPIEDTVGAMAELVKEGKVRHLGLSEASSKTLRRAARVHPIAALQTEYSLWTRDPEAEILPTCRDLGVTFVPYSPLGRGFLTGKIRSLDDLEETDWRRHMPRFQGDNFGKNLELVAKVEQIAKSKNASPAQLALAWVMAQGEGIVPIPGTTKVERLEENAGAAEIELSAAELAEIDAIVPKGVAAGLRYPEMGMATIDR